MEKFTQHEGILSNKDFISEILPVIRDNMIRDRVGIEWANVPAAFDIEASSFYIGEPPRKAACMYIWQMGIGGFVTTGRTWEQLTRLLAVLRTVLKLDSDKRLIIYIHNLAYEFQWIRKKFDWDNVFLTSEREPIYCRWGGIEFRDSMILAGGKSLKKVGEDLKKYPCQKMVGDLDYELVRSSYTPLTDKELKYCENDVRVLMSYIQEKIETDGDVTKIPLTNTGYVRRYTRDACFPEWF